MSQGKIKKIKGANLLAGGGKNNGEEGRNTSRLELESQIHLFRLSDTFLSYV